ncbi:MAG TPA: polyprenyl synthetase family protein [Actinomycetota bacterium]|nr:polyprenyl synthetase family protein [Actinomycetota bacterium]
MAAFSPSLDELRAAVDAALDEYLGRQESLAPDARELIAEIRRVLRAGGKRLRPAFCYWGYRCAGGQHSATIVRAAMSLELLHTFAVVHDDIMDASDARRGPPTTIARFGLERALLVGDLALVLADNALRNSGFPPELLGPALDAYTSMKVRVIAGQDLDVAAAGRAIDVAAARKIAVLKSGSYTVEDPLLIGATLAGAAGEMKTALAAFGRPLGEAFQLRDDVLGVFGDPAVTGKSIDADIKDGKRTFLFAATVERLESNERARFLEKWGAEDLDDEEIAWLRAAIDRSGAREAAEDLCRALEEKAQAQLDRLSISSEARAALRSLAGMAVRRAA